jgi:hypothetical protein
MHSIDIVAVRNLRFADLMADLNLWPALLYLADVGAQAGINIKR